MQETQKELIKVGDNFKTISDTDVYSGAILTVTKTENPESNNGFIYYKTDKLIGRRRNHCGRVWWFREFCRRI